MLKFGIITKLDYEKALAKVVFREEQGRDGGEKFEVWLPVMQTRTKDDAYYTMPDKGESVACLMDESWETGIIVGAVYTKKNKPKSSMKKDRAVIEFSDGTKIQYDRSAKELLIDAAKDVTIKSSSGTVKIDAMTVEVKATTAKIEATTATIKASAGTASLLDTLTGLPTHTFVPAP